MKFVDRLHHYIDHVKSIAVQLSGMMENMVNIVSSTRRLDVASANSSGLTSTANSSINSRGGGGVSQGKQITSLVQLSDIKQPDVYLLIRTC